MSIDALWQLVRINDRNDIVNDMYAEIRLKKLELNKWGASTTLIGKFIEALKDNREIEELRLSSLSFNSEMIYSLGEFVAQNFNLKSLNLSWAEIQSEDMLKLLNRIKHIKHLQHFDLSTMPFGEFKSGEIIESLKELIIGNPSLIHLNLNRWSLDLEQIKILWIGIKKSKSLLAVHLSGNKTSNKNISNFLKPEGRDRAIQKFLMNKLFSKKLSLVGMNVNLLTFLKKIQTQFLEFQRGLVNRGNKIWCLRYE